MFPLRHEAPIDQVVLFGSTVTQVGVEPPLFGAPAVAPQALLLAGRSQFPVGSVGDCGVLARGATQGARYK